MILLIISCCIILYYHNNIASPSFEPSKFVRNSLSTSTTLRYIMGGKERRRPIIIVLVYTLNHYNIIYFTAVVLYCVCGMCFGKI